VIGMDNDTTAFRKAPHDERFLPDVIFAEMLYGCRPVYSKFRCLAMPELRTSALLGWGETVVFRENGSFDELVLDLGERTWAHVNVLEDRIDLRIGGESHSEVIRQCDFIVDQFGRYVPDEGPPETGTHAKVSFWTYDGNAHAYDRWLAVSPLEEVLGNYSERSVIALRHLCEDFKPTDSGLILWHGEPGTGKSRAVEVVADAWRNWCDVHFITDPERFLSSGSAYLFEVMHSGSEQQLWDDRPTRDAEDDRWRLIVLEDSGELLSVDAANVTGQGLARLLNLTDGAMGKSMRTIVLITTNEPVKKIHPALQRPGRCLQLHEFDRLSVDESTAWLIAHDLDPCASEPMTLAELYSLLSGGPQTAPVLHLGFGG
jgi:hypothetical protein